jgi:predicted TIM-barrel fold metal-dependent hydrolase
LICAVSFFRFSLLEELGLSFDLHLNPHQMLDAAAFLAGYPGVTIILDHLGCPKCARASLFAQMLWFMTIAVFVSFVVARRLGVDAAADEALLAQCAR